MADNVAVCGYPMIVRENWDVVLASVPDLRCDAVGATAEDAIRNVGRAARRVLDEFSGCDTPLPKPSQITVRRMELPEPRRQSGTARDALRAT
jgi:hypothetical protein